MPNAVRPLHHPGCERQTVGVRKPDSSSFWRSPAPSRRRLTRVAILGLTAIVGLSLPWPLATAAPRAGASMARYSDTQVRLAPSIRGVPLTSRVVALTFDDGPNPVYTPQVLDLLRQSGAHATFFVLGQEALRYPNLLKREVRAGNEVGLHGMRHLVLYDRQPSEVEAEVGEAEDTITGILGKRPVLYRLPQGKGDTVAREVLGRRGYLVIQWSVDPRDYLRPPAETMVASVMRQVKPGAIIIFHDGGGPRARTMEALQQVLPQLKREGYTVTTVSDLLGRAHFPLPRPAEQAPSTLPAREHSI